MHATDDVKEAKLYKFLCDLGEGSRVICFANTKRRVDMLEKVTGAMHRTVHQCTTCTNAPCAAPCDACKGTVPRLTCHAVACPVPRHVATQ